MIMRKPRVLAASAWYWVTTAVNRHERIFLERNAVSLFNRVFREAGALFPVEMRRLRIEADRVSFYIRPVNGFQLPEIMQWIKQTFAVRYNVMKRLDGHVWGDRYWSKVLEGEAPEEGRAAKGAACGDCGEGGGEGMVARGEIPEARPEKGPSADGDSHHEGETAENNGSPPDLPRRPTLLHG
ncbi:MAG: transposase [Spirochaetaceae bacterium]|jgi:REP element-mobilizing transposase RayT|nr:transposase [Spirochaetaceae bacterium]